MSIREQRTNTRFPLTIRATVIDPVSFTSFSCVIRDGSITGCRILCDHVEELPDAVGLDVPSIERIIEGQIVWRTEKAAGVAFDWEKTQGGDSNSAQKNGEKRGAPRQNADLPAVVLDREFKPVVNCTICDISRTGCRVVIPDDTVIPSKIYFEVENLTRAVMARVIWRKDNLAGVEFVTDGDVYVLEDDEAQPVDAQETQA